MKRQTKIKVVIALTTLGLFGCFLLFGLERALAATGINKTINFQGRITKSSDGSWVTDGTYNFTFKAYSVASGGTALWTETKSLTLVRGVFHTDLGDTTAFGSLIDFNTDNIYLGITFSTDSEMTPRVRFTATPYAMNSDTLDGMHVATSGANAHVAATDASGNLTVSGNTYFNGTTYYVNSAGQGLLNTLGVGTASQFAVNASGVVTAGTWNGSTIGVTYGGTGTNTQFTQGSIVFAGAAGVYSQDNSNLFWDNTNKRLGIGVATPTAKLSIATTGSENLFNISASGSDLVNISTAQATFNLPTSFAATGDVSLGNDLIFTNQTSSSIKTNAPLTIETGELFESNDITLRTFNSGGLVLDTPGGITSMQAQTWNLATSTSALNIASGLLNIDTTNSRIGIGTTTPAALLSVGTTSQFQVTSAGAVTAVGVNSGTGLIQGTGGLTITGAAISLNASSNFATSINTGTSTGTITLGGGSSPLVIDSTNFDVTSAGALSGITGYTQASGNFSISGAGTFGTGTGAISLNGATTIAANQNLAMASGTGTFVQTYTGTTTSAATITANSVTTASGLALSVNGLTTGNGMYISSTSTAGGASGSSYLLNLSRSGANANATHTAYGLYSAVTDTGTTSKNVAGYFSATGATTNYGLVVANGSVGIGTTAPSALLSVGTGTTTNFGVNSSGQVTSGTWMGTAVGVGYGGTGLTATPTNGQLLIGNGTGYTLGTLTQGTGISITNASGSITLANSGVTSLTGTTSQVIVSASTGAITLSLPQNIANTSTPTFAGLTVSGLTAGSIPFIGAGGALSQNNSKFFWDNTNYRLGIGTATPNDSLDLFGTSSALRLSYDATNYARLSSSSTGELLVNPSIAGGSAVTIGNGSAKNAMVVFDENNYDYYVGEDNSDGKFKIGLGVTMGTTPYLTIDSAGKVGIGNTAPGTLLHVGSSTTTTNNQVTIQDSDGTCTLNPASGASWSCSSDRNLKYDITSLDGSLDKVLQLSPSKFKMKVDGSDGVGFIAQEVQGIIPEAVSLLPDGNLGIDATRMIPYIVGAIKGENDQINLLATTSSAQSLSIEELRLKTEQGVTTVSELQSSVDSQLGIIGEGLSSLDQRMKLAESADASQSELNGSIQEQLDAIKTVVDDSGQQLAVAQAQIDLSVADINYIKTVLGLTEGSNPGDVTISGKLTAQVVNGGSLEMSVTDEEKPTIGTAVLTMPDFATGSDGKSIEVKTKAVTDLSKIFTTFQGNPGSFSWVEKRQDKDNNYTGFTIFVAEPVTKDVKVDWWIVESK